MFFFRRFSIKAGLGIVFILLSYSCAAPTPEPTSTPLPTKTSSVTATLESTNTPTITKTPTSTLTPTITLTPSPSETPTPQPLTATATGNANCRWGPGTAYNGKSTFDEGQTAVVEARDYTSRWVYIQPPNFKQHCWVSISTVELSGDIKQVGAMGANLPSNSDVPIPSGVSAERNGNNVTVSWNPVPDAPEVGYLLEVIVCQNGYSINAAYSTENTSITIADEQDCSGNSQGTLRSSNKLGYSAPATIPWP